MKIELKIFNNILYGDLRPWLESNKSEEKFRKFLSPSFKVPKGGPDAFMKALETAMKKNPHFNIEEDYKLEIKDNKIKISTLHDEIFEPLINIDIPPHYSPRTEFYYYLIVNEGTRLMNNLNKAIEVCKTQTDAKFQINGTLTKIKALLKETGKKLKELSYSDKLSYDEMPADPIEAEKKVVDYILDVLCNTLMRLIYEIQELYEPFLGSPAISEDQIYFQYLGKTPPSTSLVKVSSSMSDFGTKRYVEKMEYSKANTLKRLDDAKDIILWHFRNDKLPKEFAEKKDTVLENIMVLENLYYVREFGFEETNPSYEKLKSPEYTEEILNKAYADFESMLDEQSTANKKLKALVKAEEILSYINTKVKIDEDAYKQSIPRRLLTLLKGTRAFLEANLSVDFSKLKVLEFNKIKVDLTVPELALFFRSMVDAKLITTKQKTDLFKAISATFSTKKQDDVSEKSIKNHFDTPDVSASENLHGKLLPLLQMAKKFKDS